MSGDRLNWPVASLKRAQAILCLLSLLAGQSQVLACALAFASLVEGSHTTRVSISDSGVKVVLSHERGQPGRPDFLPQHDPANPLHHHGLASKILCTLAGSMQPLADHVACFRGVSAAERSSRQLSATVKQVPTS